MEKKVRSILVCGVGGQGIILASAVMAETFLKAGYDVKQGEVHGMAQRGGAVISFVRFGPQVFSPIPKMGEVDFLFSTEKLEALRWVNWCNPETVVICDEIEIPPPMVNLGVMEYPKDIEEFFKANFRQSYLVPATKIAVQLGNPRVANVVLLGKFSSLLDIPQEIWEESLKEHVPERFQELNIQAFRIGRNSILS